MVSLSNVVSAVKNTLAGRLGTGRQLASGIVEQRQMGSLTSIEIGSKNIELLTSYEQAAYSAGLATTLSTLAAPFQWHLRIAPQDYSGLLAHYEQSVEQLREALLHDELQAELKWCRQQLLSPAAMQHQCSLIIKDGDGGGEAFTEGLHRLGLSARNTDAKAADNITPSLAGELKEHLIYIKLGEQYARTLFAANLPANVQLGWLLPLLRLPGISMEISIHCRQGQLTQQDGQTIPAYQVQLYVAVLAAEIDELQTNYKVVQGIMTKLGVITQSADSWQGTTYQMVQPGSTALAWQQGNRAKKAIHLCTEVIIAATSLNLIVSSPANKGIFVGLNEQDGTPVLQALHKGIELHIGVAGSGKTTSLCNQILRGWLWNPSQRVYCIDMQGGMTNFTKAIGGQRATFGCLAGNSLINCLDRVGLVGELLPLVKLASWLRAFFSSLTKTTLTTSDVAKLMTALKGLDAECQQAGGWARRQPILADLLPHLEACDLSLLAQRLNVFVDPEIYGALFNGPTNVAATYRFACFALRDVPEELKVGMMMLVMNFALHRPCGELGGTLVIEELGRLMISEQEVAESWLLKFYQEARANCFRLIATEQSLKVFQASVAGRSILDRASAIYLSRQAWSGSEATILHEELAVSKRAVEKLHNAVPGEVMILSDEQLLHVRQVGLQARERVGIGQYEADSQNAETARG